MPGGLVALDTTLGSVDQMNGILGTHLVRDHKEH